MFLLTDTSAEMVLGMFYLTLSNANIHFADKDLTWKFYTTVETLFIIKWVELIDKKKFAKIVLDENVKAFVMYMTFLSLSLLKRCWMKILKLL